VTRRTLALDTAIAAGVLGLTLFMLASRGLGTPDQNTTALGSVGVLLGVATAVPLVVRRLAPLSAYAATGTASLLLLWLGYGLDFPFGVLVAIYGVGEAYGSDERAAWRRGAMLGVAGFLVAVVARSALRYEWPLGDMLPGLAVWALLIAGAWVSGDRNQLRRERIAQLEEQARHLEREREQERRVALAEERIRIARELHDSAGHAINVILVQAGAARLLQERDPAGSRQAIVTLEEVARRTIGEIDRLVHALRRDDGAEPVAADPGGIEELVERHRAAGLPVALQVPEPRQPPPRSVAWAAYRILQEALTNATRHGAGQADVVVRFGEDAIEVTVTNPTDPDRPDRGGHGIVGMRERAWLLGGTLEVGDDNGTFRLHARLPHAAQPHAAQPHDGQPHDGQPQMDRAAGDGAQTDAATPGRRS
jgi:signal transduction histidine kinase